MALEGRRFSSVSEAMKYFKPFNLGSHKVNKKRPASSSMWVFWSNKPDENFVAHYSIEDRIRRVLITISRQYHVYSIVQFWAVERIAGRQCTLTTSHQPFSITGLDKFYCSYRNKCMRRNINVDPEADELQLGPSGRAFRNGCVDYSQDIGLYTIQEFPLRDDAILCNLNCVESLPVFELDSNNIVGVLEFLCPWFGGTHWNHVFIAIYLKEVGLRINYNGSSESMDREKYLKDVSEKVHKMFKEVSKTHPLALGLASVPCCKEYCLNCSGTGCLEKQIAVYKVPHMSKVHKGYTPSNGISGRAYASGKSCFCRDIRNFSILECPLAHHARLAGLTFSFATCVQSIQDENDTVLVLEFLLLPGCYDIENIRLFTGSLLTKIKELLPYYKVAGEDFPGEELFPQSYDSSKYDEIDHIQVSNNPLSLPVTLTCSCDDPCYICEFNNEEEIVGFFLPVNLSYSTSRKNIFPVESSDDRNKMHDALVLWRNDAEKFDEVGERIKHVFKRVPMEDYLVDLVQFWAPRRIAGTSFLTTFDQPFAVNQNVKKVTCLYRIECMRRNIYVDGEGSNEEQLGPAGRAFKQGVVECSPDVRLYSIQEFPLRDHAVFWDIQRAMFLPVFELHGKGPIGVLEILDNYSIKLGTYLKRLTMELKGMGFRIDYVHLQSGQLDSLAEIDKIFEAISVRYPLHLARTLTPCLRDCCRNSSSVGCSKQEAYYIKRIWSRSRMYTDGFLTGYSFHQLLDKNGVAGKALTSRRSCFCMNIGKWGIKDYPLSHCAELYQCNFSVAIYVENTQLVDAPCVLEFFLLPGDYSNEYIGGLLDFLLISLKQYLPPNFKVVSDHVPGEPFFVEIGKKMENDGVHDVAGGETNQLVPRENDFGLPIADCQESISGIYVFDGIEATTLVIQGENDCEMHLVEGTEGTEPTTVTIEEEDSFQIHVSDETESTLPDPQGVSISKCVFEVGTIPVSFGQTNCSTKPSTSQMKANKRHISLDVLKLHYGKPLDKAAKDLGVSRSKLKRISRSYGIRRWPSHEKNKVNQSLFMKENLNDPTPPILPMQPSIHSTHDFQTDQHQAVSQGQNQINKIVTIKASYGYNAILKFNLNTSSTLQDLQEQVMKRLKWEANSFEIKYQDEAKDWITIIIDEDLQYCLHTSIDRCETTVCMSINLKKH